MSVDYIQEKNVNMAKTIKLAETPAARRRNSLHSMASFFVWLEGTGVATTVRDSLMLTGALSAVHLIGFTLVTGGALVANLNLLGVLFRDRAADRRDPARHARDCSRGWRSALLTGVLLFAPRATRPARTGSSR